MATSRKKSKPLSKNKTKRTPATSRRQRSKHPLTVTPTPDILTQTLRGPQTVLAAIEATPYISSSKRQRSTLPDSYGDNSIYLLVRDPYWLFSYWEIQKDHQEKTLAKLGGDWAAVQSILRVFDVTHSDDSFCDIVLQGLAQDWYLEVQPNRSYIVEIGLKHRDGRYVTLARSNKVTTPRDCASDVIDEEWMALDFDKVYALSGGFELGKSSAELRKLMQQRLFSSTTSGSGGSVTSAGKGKARGFWFTLDCELIVYGATEPNAKVIFQGKPIKLNPDGTFSIRMALPDGKLNLKTQAISADNLEERIITPLIERRTERPAPRLKAED